MTNNNIIQPENESVIGFAFGILLFLSACLAFSCNDSDPSIEVIDFRHPEVTVDAAPPSDSNIAAQMNIEAKFDSLKK